MSSKSKYYNIHLNSTDKEKSIQIEFNSDKVETKVFELLKIHPYQMYQFIQDDYTFNMDTSELERQNIKFKSIKKERKLGLGYPKR